MKEKQQTVLITGGSSGIGLELAKIFAKNGYDLVLVARDQLELDRAAETIQKESNVDVKVISKDLFDIENAFVLHDDLQSMGIDVDILVNDAGQGHYGQFIETDLNAELAIIQLNISSLVALTKLFVMDMVQRGSGKILNVSSIASQTPGPYHSVYHGTKAFVQSFTEALRYELKDKGIGVTALLPGATDTDFFNKAEMLSSKIVQEGELADPANVAKDGYDALIADKDKVVSGFKNKMQVKMASLKSDEKNAENMGKQQKPVDADQDE